MLKNLKNNMRELPAQHTKFLYILPIFGIDRFILYQIYFTFVIEENMKKGLFILLIFCFSLTIISCSDVKEESTTIIWKILQECGKVSAENTKYAEHYTSYGNSFRIYGDFEEILK